MKNEKNIFRQMKNECRDSLSKIEFVELFKLDKIIEKIVEICPNLLNAPKIRFSCNVELLQILLWIVVYRNSILLRIHCDWEISIAIKWIFSNHTKSFGFWMSTIRNAEFQLNQMPYLNCLVGRRTFSLRWKLNKIVILDGKQNEKPEIVKWEKNIFLFVNWNMNNCIRCWMLQRLILLPKHIYFIHTILFPPKVDWSFLHSLI